MRRLACTSILRLLFVGTVLTMLAWWGQPREGQAGVPPDVALKKGQAILGRMEARMQGLMDFTARVQAKVRVPLLPRMGVTGKVYFKRPNQVKVEIERLPRWVERFRQQFSGLSPTQRDRRDYVPRYEGDEAVDAHACYRLVLTPKSPQASNVQEIRMWVDQKDLTVLKVIARYSDGSEVTSLTRYGEVNRYLLPVTQDTQITSPRAGADVSATYSDYAINQNLPDSVFEKGAR